MVPLEVQIFHGVILPCVTSLSVRPMSNILVSHFLHVSVTIYITNELSHTIIYCIASYNKRPIGPNHAHLNIVTLLFLTIKDQ